MSNLIKIAGEGVVIEDHNAAAAITPGMLIERISAGTVQKHGTAKGVAISLWALDRPELNKAITDDYATGDEVKAFHAYPGCIINALLKNGENVAIGDKLVSDGAGGLQKYVAPQDTAAGGGAVDIPQHQIVATALAALNNTSGAQARLLVETC